MTRTFAYRCGGSDGITDIRLTVFPFNPLTEQSKGHLQTSSRGWFIYLCLSSGLITNSAILLMSAVISAFTGMTLPISHDGF
jgi:hypothetical protein